MWLCLNRCGDGHSDRTLAVGQCDEAVLEPVVAAELEQEVLVAAEPEVLVLVKVVELEIPLIPEAALVEAAVLMVVARAVIMIDPFRRRLMSCVRMMYEN